MTSHGYLYEFLRDQGSFIGGLIAGILTLVGGALAYFAGQNQAKATGQSASAQVKAIREQKDQSHEDATAQIQAIERQMNERNRELADVRRSQMIETVRALSTEAARIERFARDRLQIAETRYSETPDKPIDRFVAPFRIAAHEVLNKVSIVDFRGTLLMPMATRLNAMVDVLESALESAGVMNELEGAALIGHLKNVIVAARNLKERLEKWECDNPVSQ